MGTEAMTVMASAVVPVQAHETKHIRASRERLAKRRTAEEVFVFPPNEKCFRVVHRAMQLRQHGFRDGEIDDRVGREEKLEGWQVQYICIWFAEQMVRQLEAATSLTLNVADSLRRGQKQVFSEAPGRPW
jgi:hypothetical protein